MNRQQIRQKISTDVTTKVERNSITPESLGSVLDSMATNLVAPEDIGALLAGEKGNVSPSTDPATITVDGIYRASQAGDYSNLAQGLVAEAGYVTWFLKSGNTWTLYSRTTTSQFAKALLPPWQPGSYPIDAYVRKEINGKIVSYVNEVADNTADPETLNGWKKASADVELDVEGGAASYGVVKNILANISQPYLRVFTDFTLPGYDGGWRMSEPVPVKEGDWLRLELYGDAGFAIELFDANMANPENHINFNSETANVLKKEDWVSPKDGFVKFRNRVANNKTDYFAALVNKTTLIRPFTRAGRDEGWKLSEPIQLMQGQKVKLRVYGAADEYGITHYDESMGNPVNALPFSGNTNISVKTDIEFTMPRNGYIVARNLIANGREDYYVQLLNTPIYLTPLQKDKPGGFVGYENSNVSNLNWVDQNQQPLHESLFWNLGEDKWFNNSEFTTYEEVIVKGYNKMRLAGNFGSAHGILGRDEAGNIVWKGTAAELGVQANVDLEDIVRDIPPNVYSLQQSSRLTGVNKIELAISGIITHGQILENVQVNLDNITDYLKTFDVESVDLVELGFTPDVYFNLLNPVGTNISAVSSGSTYDLYNPILLEDNVVAIQYKGDFGSIHGIAFLDENLNYTGDFITGKYLNTAVDEGVAKRPEGAMYIAFNTKRAQGLVPEVKKLSNPHITSNKYLLDKWTVKGNREVKYKPSIGWTLGKKLNNNKQFVDDVAWQYIFLPIKKGRIYDIVTLADNWENTDLTVAAVTPTPDVNEDWEDIITVGSVQGPAIRLAASFEAEDDGYLFVQMRTHSYSQEDLDNNYGITELQVNVSMEVDAEYLLKNSAGISTEVLNSEILNLDKPDFAYVYFEGQLPIDTSDARTPTALSFEMFDQDGKSLVSSNCELSIQGHGSVSYEKKGYTFDVFNKAGKALVLKFGNMVAVDSFHMKAYATDRTHSRDVANGRIWADMVRTNEYPFSRINNKPYQAKLTGRQADLFPVDCQYHTDGFPIAAYLNGEFLGIYTMRLKKARDNYYLNNRDMNHIFLDSSTYTAFLNKAFDYRDWDIKSPRMTDYEEAGPVPDAAVLASINRLTDFTRQLNTRYAEHADYIVLPHWVDWYIFSELIGNVDTNGNNYNIITWDNTHWTILPYDMDLTLGLNAWSGYTVEANKTGLLINHDIWTVFRTRYITEIRARYTQLRRTNKFLTHSNLVKYYYNQVKNVPREFYEMDKARWPLIWTNAEPTLLQIEVWLQSRLEYLDSQWLNP